MTAALPFGYGLINMFLQVGFILLAVSLPRFVMRQDVFLCLAVQNINIANR
jgi:hypothetical protein